jgi:outer membrane protein TolC
MTQRLSRMTMASTSAVAALLASGCAPLSADLSPSQIETFTGSISREMIEASPPVAGVLDAEQAVLRALNYNAALEAKALEAAISAARVRVDAGAMLPDIIAETDYYRRDRRALSHSSLSSTYSTSSDLATLTNSIAMSWNLIDFGLSYLRTRQSEDRARRDAEDVRLTASRLIEDTRSNYWNAVALHALTPRLATLDGEVEDALRLSRKAASDPTLDPAEFIQFQRETLNLRRELNDIFAQVAGADYRLKELAAVRQSAPLRLDGKRDLTTLRLPSTVASADVALALRQRPEIRQHMYDLRITDQEVDAAVLSLLPGATISQTFTSDSNSFLLHGNWLSWSTRIAANLIELARLPAKFEAIDAEKAALRQSAIATASAITMQVHLSRARAGVLLRTYRDAEQFAVNQRRIHRQVQMSVKAGKTAAQALATEGIAALLAEVRAILAFGELHAALAAYETSIGITPHPHSTGTSWQLATHLETP